MASKVYFTDMRTQPGSGMLKKLEKLLVQAELEKLDLKDKLVALKIHFGEPGNMAYIRPNYAAVIVRKIKQMGGKPFLTDCNTLYYGKRANAVDHLQAAMQNGFNRIAVGCDVVIADGLTGTDAVEISINRQHVKKAKIGSAIAQADALISINHFKGHEQTGFGGAIKNLGMGSGSRKGKLEMHSASKPKMVEEHCVACGMCIRNCPEGAIAYNKRHKAQIDYSRCIGCGQCVASCHYGAAQVVWDEAAETLGEKIAEYAYAAIKGKDNFHINFVMDVSPDCDCWSINDQPIVADIGIAASSDPVALDRACVDLVNQAPAIANSRMTNKGKYLPGEDKFRHIHPSVRWQNTLKHAENIGLGRQEYKIIKVS
ncbi:MAG TPA: DUF362 domain-containing protein [Anaerolineae bacterium]|nr:DUF362 domain-containing protein [Anaerolineae bacterium]